MTLFFAAVKIMKKRNQFREHRMIFKRAMQAEEKGLHHACSRTLTVAACRAASWRDGISQSRNVVESGVQDCRAIEAAFAQFLQGFICLAQRERNRSCFDIELRGERKKGFAIGAREVGDRAHYALSPQQRIGKLRNVAHMNAGADYGRSFAGGRQRKRNQRADWSKQNRGVKQHGRYLSRIAGPGCPERARKCLRARVARTREGIHFLSLLTGDLRDDVRGGAESVQPDAMS